MRKPIGLKLEEDDIAWLNAEAKRRSEATGRKVSRTDLVDEGIKIMRHGGELPMDARRKLEAKAGFASREWKPDPRQEALNKQRGKSK